MRTTKSTRVIAHPAERLCADSGRVVCAASTGDMGARALHRGVTLIAEIFERRGYTMEHD